MSYEKHQTLATNQIDNEVENNSAKHETLKIAHDDKTEQK